MLLTGWSYRQLCELPDGYFPVLIQVLQKRARERQGR